MDAVHLGLGFIAASQRPKPQPHVGSSPVWSRRQTRRRTALNTPGCVHGGAHFRDATFRRGGTSAQCNNHSVKKQKAQRSRCSASTTCEVTANSPAKDVDFEGHLLLEVHSRRTANFIQLGELDAQSQRSPRSLMPCRVPRWETALPALCSRAARKYGNYVEFQVSSRQFPGRITVCHDF